MTVERWLADTLGVDQGRSPRSAALEMRRPYIVGTFANRPYTTVSSQRIGTYATGYYAGKQSSQGG